MDYKAKQEELDLKKWLESERQGKDTCGEYEYCACCDKDAEYPCARASEKKEGKKPAAKSAAKPAAAKSAAKPAAKTAVKPAAAKPAGAKKPAAKK